MEFNIENGPVFTTLKAVLKQGEQIKAEAGAMVSMSSSISLEAKSTGKGLFGTIAAAVGGESFFASIFTANLDGEVVLAPSVIGDIIKIDINNQTILAQSGAYLAGSINLNISTQGSLKAMISGEGLFLSKITGSGLLFLNSYGAVFEKVLSPGEIYIVDSGHIVAFESNVSYKIRKAARGLFSTLASGEGLVSEFTGPGKLWIQTRNLPAFASILSRFLPKKS